MASNDDRETRDSTPEAPEDQDRRPTPVRVVMEGEGEEGESEREEKPLRGFTDPRSGEDWVVRVSGRSGSGILPLRSIPLMELIFARAQEPDQPLKRTTRQGSELDSVTDGDLAELLATATAYRPPLEERISEPRRGGRGRGRGRRRSRS